MEKKSDSQGLKRQREEESAPSAQEGKDLPTSLQPDSKKKTHPKGHKVHLLSEVTKLMDAEEYLRVSDTNVLNDVWNIPVGV